MVFFLLSVLSGAALVLFITLASGGSPAFLLNPPLLLGMLVLPLGMTAALGGGRSLRLLLRSPCRWEALGLAEVRGAVRAVDFFLKVTLYGALFFMLSGLILLWSNVGVPETVGPNLSMVILSPFYAVLVFAVLMPLRARMRRRTIMFMADGGEASPWPSVRRGLPPALRAILFLCVTCAVVLFVVRWAASDKNGGLGAANFIDLPSLIVVLLSVPMLAVSGTLKDFGHAVALAATGRAGTPTERHLAVNALSLMRSLLLCCGLLGTLGGFIAMMSGIALPEALAANISVSLIPMFYAVVPCVALLAVQDRLESAHDAA